MGSYVGIRDINIVHSPSGNDLDIPQTSYYLKGVKFHVSFHLWSFNNPLQTRTFYLQVAQLVWIRIPYFILLFFLLSVWKGIIWEEEPYDKSAREPVKIKQLLWRLYPTHRQEAQLKKALISLVVAYIHFTAFQMHV